MARKMDNNINKFNLKDAPVVKENERILEKGKTASQMIAEDKEKQAEVEASSSAPATTLAPPAPPTPSVAPASPVAPITPKTGKKTQNGITIYVPMDYYMQILRLKMETGTPIKDIALQAVIEYLDRHKGE